MPYKVEKRGGARPFAVINTRDNSVVATCLFEEDAKAKAENLGTADHKENSGLDSAEVQAAGAAKASLKSGVSDEDGTTTPGVPEEAESSSQDEPVAPEFAVEESREVADGTLEKRRYESGSIRYVKVSGDSVETIKKADFEAAGEADEAETDSEPSEPEAPADEAPEAPNEPESTDTETPTEDAETPAEAPQGDTPGVNQEGEAPATDETESEGEDSEQPASEDTQEDSSTPEPSEPSDGGSDANSDDSSQSEGEQK